MGTWRSDGGWQNISTYEQTQNLKRKIEKKQKSEPGDLYTSGSIHTYTYTQTHT